MAGDMAGTGVEDTQITGTLMAVDVIDGLSDGSYFTLSTNAGHGIASIDTTSGVWTYDPTANYNCSDTFIVTITDDDGHSPRHLNKLTATAHDHPPQGTLSARLRDVRLINISRTKILT